MGICDYMFIPSVEPMDSLWVYQIPGAPTLRSNKKRLIKKFKKKYGWEKKGRFKYFYEIQKCEVVKIQEG